MAVSDHPKNSNIAMDPLQGDVVTNNSCSCTSCDYNSESDCQTLIRLLAQGSRINRLFNGKYLPLRESKLMGKLVRTRALYDALKNQLLSGSISVSSKDSLKPKQTPLENNNSLATKKCGDILSLVDLVDIGTILGSRKLSECCSCCNCNSITHHHENVQKGRRNRQGHAGSYIPSKSSVASKHGTGEDFKLGKQFKAKNIKSDPCTCARKIEELLKLQSRAMLKKMHPEQPWQGDRLLSDTDKNKFLSINNDKLRKSYHKLKRYKARPNQYIENMGEGGIPTIRKLKPHQDNLELKRMSSIEKLKLAEQKIKDSFINDRKNTQKLKPEGVSSIKNIAETNALQKKKDLAMKFRGEKQQLQNWELQQRVRRLRNNDPADKDNNNMNITSGTPNLSDRKLENVLEKATTKQQKSPLRNRNYYDTLPKIENERKDISKPVKREVRVPANPIQPQKSKIKKTSILNKNRPVKSMSSIKPPQITHKGNLPLANVIEKKPIKSQIRKSLGKVLKPISTTSIKKLPFLEKNGPKVNGNIAKKTPLKLINNENKMKPDLLVPKPKKNMSLDAPMRFEPRRRLREEKEPDIPKKSLDSKQKKQKKTTHALKRCLCTLKIKVKNTKSAITKTKNIKAHRSKTPHGSRKALSNKSNNMNNVDTRPEHKSSTRVIKCECNTDVDIKDNRDSNELRQTRSPTVTTKDKGNITDPAYEASECECPDSDINIKQKGTPKHKASQTNIRPDLKSNYRAYEASECECLDTDINSKQKGTPKHKASQTNIRPDLKSTSTAYEATECECPDTGINSKQKGRPKHKASQTNIRPDLKSTSTAYEATECECPDIGINSKQKGRPKHKASQTNIRPDLKSMYPAHDASECECPNTDINSKQKGTPKHKASQTNIRPDLKSTYRAYEASECECPDTDINSKKKGTPKYKTGQTNTHPEIKSISHAYTETKDERKFVDHSTQTINNEANIEKQGCNKLCPGYKINDTHSALKSFVNNVTNYKCPIVTEQNIDLSLKKQEMNDKRRVGLQFSKKGFSKDSFIIPIHSDLKSKQGTLRIIKCGAKMKHTIQSTTPQTSNSSGKLNYKKTKHGLTRCFCTLKLSTVEKKKNKFRKHSNGLISVCANKSEYIQTQPKIKSVSISTGLGKKKLSRREERKLIKHIKVRKSKHKSSLTSQSMQPSLVPHNSAILVQTLYKNQYKLLHNKRSPELNSPLTKNSEIKHDSYTIRFNKDDIEEKKKSQHKSSLVKVKKRLLLGSTIGRYLFIMKINKKDKRIKKDNAIDSNAKTEVEKMYPELKNFARVTKSQKNKMTSKSSDTQEDQVTSPDVLKKRRCSSQKLRHIKKHSVLVNNISKHNDKYLEIGSNFSFNIEFFKDIVTENNFAAKELKNMNVYFSHNIQEGKQLEMNDKKLLEPRRLSAVPLVSKFSASMNDVKHGDDKLITKFVMQKPTDVDAKGTVTVAQTKVNLPETILLEEADYVNSYNPVNSTEKALDHIKPRKYLRKHSTSNVFSVAFKSNKIQSYIGEKTCNFLQINSMDQSIVDFTSKETIHLESKFDCEIKYEKSVRFKNENTLRSAHSEINSFAQSQNEKNVVTIQEIKHTPIVIKGITNNPELTGIYPFLRRCYCTMNVHVAQHSPRRRHHQLKDYECEPGVCIPYECDPNECKKMIMRRLMKKVSRMSGTENRYRSSSSITSSTKSCDECTGPRQRRIPRERHHRPERVRHTGLKYQTLPRSPNTQKQAVRIGSNFSFNVEFSKGSSKSAPTADYIERPRRSTRTRSSRTSYGRRRDRGIGYERGRRHRGSQSAMRQMRHRGSSVSPMLKRCFCTLKLQKKGRQQKERELQMLDQGTSTPPKFNVEKPMLRTTETGQNTKRRYPDLLPYECEPNVCVPGECDPHKCLELIKKRNKHTREFGTDLMKSNLTSSSSMTSNQRRTRQRHVQARNIRGTPRSSDTIERSRPSLIESQGSSKRDVVRIGSNFSFNIEFYKDKSSPGDERQSVEIYEHKPRRQVRKLPKHVHVRQRMRNSSSQDRKFTRNTDSQASFARHGRSTMTGAFLKRCFCTAKLQQNKVDTKPKSKPKPTPKSKPKPTPKSKPKPSPKSKPKPTPTQEPQHTPTQEPQRISLSTLKQCLCHLKLLAGKKEPKKPAKIKQVSSLPEKEAVAPAAEAEKKQVTPLAEKQHVVKTQTKKRPRALEPYECEPGVCVPGQCDPYECEKRIKRRWAKEKMAGTDRPRTRSTSSSFMSSRTSKAMMTQFRPRHQYSRPRRSYERPRRRDMSSSRSMVFNEPPMSASQKQVVRIGSNFSFNVEFFKDKGPSQHEVQAAAAPARRYRRTRDQGHEARRRMRNRGSMGRGSSVYSRESQMDAIRTKDQSLGPILKRCFCTLKLHKQKQLKNQVKKEKFMDQGTSTPIVKEVPTLQSRSMMTNRYKPQPYKLKPYECEPGVCVPGECDPYECDKRIKRRLMNRASGTLTDRYRTRSTSSTTRPYRRYRDRNTQSMQRSRPRTRDTHYRVRRSETGSNVVDKTRQAVKIGSNFSFNMEFFKDKSQGKSIEGLGHTKHYGHYEKPRRTTSRSSGRSISSRNKRAQGTRAMRDMDSQVLARKMRSTMTGVAPFLKRCFCTMQLHRSEIVKKPFHNPYRIINIKCEPSVESENKSTCIRNPPQCYSNKLEPYECEPGVCVPGECDPYECEKRIRRRMMQTKQSGTDRCRGRSVSSSIGSTRSRHRRVQALSTTSSGNQSCRDRCRGEKQMTTTDINANRQVVRIGSSFSFNVEFYKDKSPQLPSARDVSKIIKGTETRPRSSRSISSCSRRPHTRHCPSQSESTKTECKASCAPLLKRCFCTLKLQKLGKQQQCTSRIEPTMMSIGTRTPKCREKIIPVAREIGTKTKKCNALDPYECEPGVCVPGFCDPYECLKRIKLRNMQSCGTGTNRACMKSEYSCTSKSTGTKSMNTHRGYRRRRPCIESDYAPKRPLHSVCHEEKTNRQAVRLGSNFSFNIEFFKDKGGFHNNCIPTNDQPRIQTRQYKSRTSTSTATPKKCRNQGLDCRQNSISNRKSQACSQKESRGSGMGPLKRCFCTLTLQRAEVRNIIPSLEPSKVKTCDKKTSTKKKCNPTPVSLKLEPYECEPYVCTPGECNPYECLERIKRRGIRRMSRTTGTCMKRTSQSCASSMAGNFIPGNRSQRTQFNEGFSPHRVERIVEEPRFSLNRGNAYKHGVKISSNFSFNIEFFKEHSSPQPTSLAREVTKTFHGRDTCTECSKTGHSTGIGTRNYCNDNQSQSDAVQTEDKSSAVALLRRCFCTAKLHRSHLGRTHHHQSLTVGRVEEIRPLSIFEPKEYWVYQCQTQQPFRKNIRSDKINEFNMKTTITNTKRIESIKLETIMAYESSKFNKNNDTIQQKPTNKKTEVYSTLRRMLKCCTHLFVKHIKQNNNKEKKEIMQPRIDLLKPTKSERHSCTHNTITAIIKKSRSLKVAKVRDKIGFKNNYSRLESGDANQDYDADNYHKSGIYFVKRVCPNFHTQFKYAVPPKQLHFALSHKDQHLDSKVSESVTLLFKASSFNPSEHKKCHELCTYCGGLKKNQTLPDLDTKKKIIIPLETLKQLKIPCICSMCRKNKIYGKLPIIKLPRAKVPDAKEPGSEVPDIKISGATFTFIRKKKQSRICGNVASKDESQRVRQKKSALKEKKREAKLCNLQSLEKEDAEIIKRRILNDKYVIKKCKRGTKRRICNKIMATLRNPMRTWKKIVDATNGGPGGAILKRLRLRWRTMTFLRRGSENIVNNTYPWRRLRSKKPEHRRRAPAFGCSHFKLSVRKRPWLVVFYAYQWCHPHCLRLLQIWRQIMDVILFLLAVPVLSPSILCMKLYRATVCCCLRSG